MEGTSSMCKICYEPGTTEEPLFYQPCQCSGAIGHVHATCLARWQERSMQIQTERCEVCGAAFRYKPCGIDWSAVFRYSCMTASVVIAGLVNPLVSTWILVFFLSLCKVIKLRMTLVHLAVGWILVIAAAILAFFAVLVVLRGPADVADLCRSLDDQIEQLPVFDNDIWGHLQRFGRFHYLIMVVFIAKWAILAGVFLVGSAVQAVTAWLVPPIAGVYTWCASAVQHSTPVKQLAEALFADLSSARQVEAAALLSSLITHYLLCTGICVTYLFLVHDAPRLFALVTKQPSHTAAKRCLQCAPFVALWCTTLALQDTMRINEMLCDCMGYDLSLLKWVFPLWFALVLGLTVCIPHARLSVKMQGRCLDFCYEYWNVRRTYFRTALNVLIGSALLMSLYLAVVLVPLRHGHYVCPLADTVVRAAVQADGRSVMIIVPQLPSLVVVFFGVALGSFTASPVLSDLIRAFGLDAWLEQPEPTDVLLAGTPLGIAGRALAVYALWLALVTVCTAWSTHGMYFLGDCLMDVLLAEIKRLSLRPDVMEVPGMVGMMKMIASCIGAIAYMVIGCIQAVVVSTLPLHSTLVGCLTKWVKVTAAVSASMVVIVYLCGQLARMVVLGLDRSITIQPASLVTVYPKGVPAAQTFLFTAKLLVLTGVVPEPTIFVLAKLPFPVAWALFQPSLLLTDLALPLTLLLLELLVVMYFLLRAAPVLLCGASVAGNEACAAQCGTDVTSTVPVFVFAAVLSMLGVRAVLQGRFSWLVPRVSARVLMNRE